MAEKPQLYKGTGIDSMHGINYEYGATCLVYLRCEKRYKEFQRTQNSGVKSFIVANNVRDFSPLDDIVVKVEYIEENSIKSKLIFVQCRHAAYPKKNPKKYFQDILDNDKIMKKYFEKFIDIHKKFQSGNNEMTLKENGTNSDHINFYCGDFTDFEFVFYTNLNPEIGSSIKFEPIPEIGQKYISRELLGTNNSDCCFRLKESESVNLACNPSDENLKTLFCEKFIVMFNQGNLEKFIAEEMKLILQSEQRIHDYVKYFKEEIRDHFNVPESRIVLSEESKVAEKIKAYVILKSQTEDRIGQFKKKSPFYKLFSDKTIRNLEEMFINNLEKPSHIFVSTNFKELEKRKVIQCFKSSGDMCVLLISNEEDERNWHIARSTKTYTKWQKVKICCDFSMKQQPPSKLKPNEILVQIDEDTRKECESIAYFEELSEETKQILLSSPVCFQGKTQEFRQIFGDRYHYLFDEDTICKILEDDQFQLNICDPFPNLEFYVQRKFIRQSIETADITRLEEIIDTSDGVKNFLLFSENDKNIPGMNETYAWFEDLATARQPLFNIPEDIDDTIHLCNFSSGSFNVVYSCGELSMLQFTERRIEEDDLIRLSEIQKVLILCDHAGMGKTTAMKHLALKYKEIYPSSWVFFFELKKCLEELKIVESFVKPTSDVEFVADKLLKLKNREYGMFVDACNDIGNVALFLDGFDELSSDDETIFISIVENLEKTKIRCLYLSSRPNNVDRLEKAFYQNSIKLTQFESKEREEFLLEHWGTRLKQEKEEIIPDSVEMKRAIRNILNRLAKTNSKETINAFLGDPRALEKFVADHYGTFILLLKEEIEATSIKIDLRSANSDAVHKTHEKH